MKITVLKQADMKSVFSMHDAIQAAKDALSLYTEGKSDIPLRVNLDVKEHGGRSLFMPGYAAEANALGIKVVSVYPENAKRGITAVPATMVLLDPETGQACSLMDGTYLTRLRTGAVSGAATELLSRKDSKVFALIGTGGQAETQLEAVLSVRNIELVKVYSTNKERREEFARRMSEAFSEKFDAKIVAADSSEEAIADADVITCVTTSKTPVFDGRLVKTGAHINGAGSFMHDMQEVDEHIVTNARAVYVDTREGVISEAGDLIIPLEKGTFSKDKTIELADVIAGKTSGRVSDNEITFFKSVGSAVLDIVTARRIYENALNKNIGGIIEL